MSTVPEELDELELEELELEELLAPEEELEEDELELTAPDDEEVDDEELDELLDELEPSVGVIPALLQPWAARAANTSKGVAKFFIASSH